MGTPIIFLFQFYELPLVRGLASPILGIIAASKQKPDPPAPAFVTIAGALDTYLHYIFMLIGALMAL